VHLAERDAFDRRICFVVESWRGGVVVVERVLAGCAICRVGFGDGWYLSAAAAQGPEEGAVEKDLERQVGEVEGGIGIHGRAAEILGDRAVADLERGREHRVPGF
jgi:hypothetical protein